jgi:hypothetical protein
VRHGVPDRVRPDLAVLVRPLIVVGERTDPSRRARAGRGGVIGAIQVGQADGADASTPAARSRHPGDLVIVDLVIVASRRSIPPLRTSAP